MDALTFVESLSNEDKIFLKTQEITSSKTAQQWIDFFRNCLNFDKIGDKARKKYGRWAMGLLIAAIVSTFLTLFIFGKLSNNPGNSSLILFFILVVLIFLTTIFLSIIFYLKYTKISSYNLKCNDNVQEKILPMLMLLREETKPEQIVKLRLDLRGFNYRDKITTTDPSYYDRGYDVTVSRFKDNWMDGETTLSDETRLIWNTQDFYTLVNKVKYKTKGRTKTKRKHKGKGLLTMQVGMDGKKYNLPPKMKDKSETGTLITKKQDNRNWMKIQRKLNYGEGSFHIKNFVDAIAAAYARAIPIQGGKK